MLAEWNRRRELKKQITSLQEREAKSRLQAKNDSPESVPELHGFEIGVRQRQLAELETGRLVRKARRLGIQIPQQESWWWEDETFEGTMSLDGAYEGKYYLTEFGKVGVSKLIREERRKSIEWWVKIITPILSAL